MTEAILEAGSWIYKMFFTLIVAVIAVASISLAIRYEINTAELQSDLMLSRILFDPTGFWYTDEGGVMHPGVVDRERFNQAFIDDAFKYPANYGGARLTLIEDMGRQQVIINERSFTDIRINVEADIKLGGGLQVYSYPVVVYQGGIRNNAILVVELARAEKT